MRITSAEYDRHEDLEEFQSLDSTVPVVAVTSKLLSTGVDIPPARNVVLFRRIESAVEFKQIIGRGTRLAPEVGKEYFTILDFTGASQRFSDPDFDGPPVRVTESDNTDDSTVPEPLEHDTTETADVGAVVEEPAADYVSTDGGTLGDTAPELGPVDEQPVTDPDQVEHITRHATRHIVDGLDVHVASEQIYVMDTQSGGLRPVSLRQWVRDRVLSMNREPHTLLNSWASARGRRELRELLSSTLCFDVTELAQRLGRPDCDPIDLLTWLAWDWPLQTRAQRVQAFHKREREYLEQLSPEARTVLTNLLEKYAAHGPNDLAPEALRRPPLSEMGTPAEIARRAFGSAGEMHEAITSWRVGCTRTDRQLDLRVVI